MAGADTGRSANPRYLRAEVFSEPDQTEPGKPQRVANRRAARDAEPAGSVLGHSGRSEKSFCRKLLKNEWVDFIASDTHNVKDRPNYMAKCYQYITKRYGQEYADLLFEANAKSIIET